MSAELAIGDRRLRASILLAVAAQAMFLIFLTVFLFNHPKGDRMEMVGVGAAFMFIFLPLSLPAFILAKEGRHLVGAALLAGLAALAYFAIWFQLLAELGIQEAPWS
ncbi:MAG: hypothetical protein ACXWVI_05990 [Methyloceanibacter sp.]